jgi:hypothetical protein
MRLGHSVAVVHLQGHGLLERLFAKLEARVGGMKQGVAVDKSAQVQLFFRIYG